MICEKCGTTIPEGMLYCPKCGKEVRIVPDYSPLDDVLEKQVRGSINNTTTPLDTYEIDEEYRRQTAERERQLNGGSSASNGRQRTGAMGNGSREGNDQQRKRLDIERRRKQAQRRKEMKRRARNRLFLLAAMVIGIILAIFLWYRGSYTGLVKRGDAAFLSKDYSKSLELYNKAIRKDEDKEAAYIGYYKVYIEQGDLDTPEAKLLSAVAEQPKNANVYEAVCRFYMDSGQDTKVSPFLSDCDDEGILSKLNKYISNAPTFSLEEGTYDDVQQVSLDTDGKEIYYTVDNTAPTTSSTRYKDPIQISEGNTIVRAITVNKAGVPSVEAQASYVVDVPVEDAPSVVPSTGQYDTAQTITISVPEGYQAFYTTDGTEPSTASELYDGPINMPEGNTIFCAVLVNGEGKTSDITKKNYELDLSQ